MNSAFELKMIMNSDIDTCLVDRSTAITPETSRALRMTRSRMFGGTSSFFLFMRRVREMPPVNRTRKNRRAGPGPTLVSLTGGDFDGQGHSEEAQCEQERRDLA